MQSYAPLHTVSMDFELCRGLKTVPFGSGMLRHGKKSEKRYVGIELQFIASQRVLMDNTLCLEMCWEKQ